MHLFCKPWETNLFTLNMDCDIHDCFRPSQLMTKTESYETAIALFFTWTPHVPSGRSQFPTSGLSWKGENSCFISTIEANRRKCFFPPRTGACKIQIHGIFLIVFVLIIFFFFHYYILLTFQNPVLFFIM